MTLGAFHEWWAKHLANTGKEPKVLFLSVLDYNELIAELMNMCVVRTVNIELGDHPGVELKKMELIGL